LDLNIGHPNTGTIWLLKESTSSYLMALAIWCSVWVLNGTTCLDHFMWGKKIL
jgi:hypothetical protein